MSMSEHERALELERMRTEERIKSGESELDHQYRAKSQVVEYWNAGAEKYGQEPIEIGQLYVVWFAFVLGNWKCLISSDAWDDTSYFEVSYTAAKEEMYVDHYRKVNNRCYPDSDEFKMAKLRKRLS